MANKLVYASDEPSPIHSLHVLPQSESPVSPGKHYVKFQPDDSDTNEATEPSMNDNLDTAHNDDDDDPVFNQSYTDIEEIYDTNNEEISKDESTSVPNASIKDRALLLEKQMSEPQAIQITTTTTNTTNTDTAKQTVTPPKPVVPNKPAGYQKWKPNDSGSKSTPIVRKNYEQKTQVFLDETGNEMSPNLPLKKKVPPPVKRKEYEKKPLKPLPPPLTSIKRNNYEKKVIQIIENDLIQEETKSMTTKETSRAQSPSEPPPVPPQMFCPSEPPPVPPQMFCPSEPPPVPPQMFSSLDVMAAPPGVSPLTVTPPVVSSPPTASLPVVSPPTKSPPMVSPPIATPPASDLLDPPATKSKSKSHSPKHGRQNYFKTVLKTLIKDKPEKPTPTNTESNPHPRRHTQVNMGIRPLPPEPISAPQHSELDYEVPDILTRPPMPIPVDSVRDFNLQASYPFYGNTNRPVPTANVDFDPRFINMSYINQKNPSPMHSLQVFHQTQLSYPFDNPPRRSQSFQPADMRYIDSVDDDGYEIADTIDQIRMKKRTQLFPRHSISNDDFHYDYPEIRGIAARRRVPLPSRNIQKQNKPPPPPIHRPLKKEESYVRMDGFDDEYQNSDFIKAMIDNVPKKLPPRSMRKTESLDDIHIYSNTTDIENLTNFPQLQLKPVVLPSETSKPNTNPPPIPVKQKKTSVDSADTDIPVSYDNLPTVSLKTKTSVVSDNIDSPVSYDNLPTVSLKTKTSVVSDNIDSPVSYDNLPTLSLKTKTSRDIVIPVSYDSPPPLPLKTKTSIDGDMDAPVSYDNLPALSLKTKASVDSDMDVPVPYENLPLKTRTTVDSNVSDKIPPALPLKPKTENLVSKKEVTTDVDMETGQKRIPLPPRNIPRQGFHSTQSTHNYY